MPSVPFCNLDNAFDGSEWEKQNNAELLNTFQAANSCMARNNKFQNSIAKDQFGLATNPLNPNGPTEINGIIKQKPLSDIAKSSPSIANERDPIALEPTFNSQRIPQYYPVYQQYPQQMLPQQWFPPTYNYYEGFSNTEPIYDYRYQGPQGPYYNNPQWNYAYGNGGYNNDGYNNSGYNTNNVGYNTNNNTNNVGYNTNNNTNNNNSNYGYGYEGFRNMENFNSVNINRESIYILGIILVILFLVQLLDISKSINC